VREVDELIVEAVEVAVEAPLRILATPDEDEANFEDS